MKRRADCRPENHAMGVLRQAAGRAVLLARIHRMCANRALNDTDARTQFDAMRSQQVRALSVRRAIVLLRHTEESHGE